MLKDSPRTRVGAVGMTDDDVENLRRRMQTERTLFVTLKVASNRIPIIRLQIVTSILQKTIAYEIGVPIIFEKTTVAAVFYNTFSPSPPPPYTIPSPSEPPTPPNPPPPPPMGCTIPQSLNYETDAVVNDGSCIIGGCIDQTNIKYDPNATFDDGSCEIMFDGCTDSTAYNYRYVANRNDGSCLYRGCMESTAPNYDAHATVPTICYDEIYGCLDETAHNFYQGATVEDGTCTFVGCTHTNANNYDAKATINDGSCVQDLLGCTNPNAVNYNKLFTTDDGSCVIPGCMNQLSVNHNPLATLNIECMCSNTCDRRRHLQEQCCPIQTANNYLPNCSNPCYDSGSFGCCNFTFLGCTDPAALNYDPSATVNANCTYVSGCMVETALNYDSHAVRMKEDSCAYRFNGCTDMNATNYVSSSTQDDGSCTYEQTGCTSQSATNYVPNATLDDGSCVFAITGCSDTTAKNFANDVTLHDQSLCIYLIKGCMYQGAINYNPNATQNIGCILFSPPPPPLPNFPFPSPPPPPRPPPDPSFPPEIRTVIAPPPSPHPPSTPPPQAENDNTILILIISLTISGVVFCLIASILVLCIVRPQTLQWLPARLRPNITKTQKVRASNKARTAKMQPRTVQSKPQTIGKKNAPPASKPAWIQIQTF